MKKVIYTILSAFILASCTASLYPIVAENDVVYKKELIGTWNSDGTTVRIDQYLTSPSRSVAFGETDSLLHPVTPEQKRANAYAAKSYLINYQEKGTAYVYEARLTSVAGDLFAEIIPYSLDNGKDPFGNHETGNAVAKVEISGKKIGLTFLDGEKLKNLVLNGKLKISYEHEKLFDQFIITANTRELRQFLEKYGSDERLFNKEDVVILTR